MFSDWSFLLIFIEPWFWQGILVNASFSSTSFPFTRKMLYKIFKNRKSNRIKNAFNEIKIFCLQQIIKERHINKNEFKKALVHSILEVDLIDNDTKEKIENKVSPDSRTHFANSVYCLSFSIFWSNGTVALPPFLFEARIPSCSSLYN